MLLRAVIFLLFSSLFVACSTMKPANDDDTERKIKTAKINVQLGIAYLERHNIQRAKQKLILALDQAPQIPEPWYSMAYFLETTGDTEQANKYYLKAIETAPNRGDCQNNYGTFLCRKGEHQKSITYFLAAVKDPDYLDVASAYENAGLCALKIPDNRLATKYFKMAIMQDPNRALALLKLSDLYYQKGNFPASKQKLDQFLAISPSTKQSVMLSARLEKKLQVLRNNDLDKPVGDKNYSVQVRVAALNEKPLPPPITNDKPLATKIKLREKFLKPIQPTVVSALPAQSSHKKAQPTEPPPKSWRGIKKNKQHKKILVEIPTKPKKPAVKTLPSTRVLAKVDQRVTGKLVNKKIKTESTAVKNKSRIVATHTVALKTKRPIETHHKAPLKLAKKREKAAGKKEA